MFTVMPNYSNTRLGGGGRVYRVARIVIHPKNGPDQFSDDLAMLQLFEPIPLGYQFRAVRLPNRPPPIGSYVTVAGWGSLSSRPHAQSNYLMKAAMPLISAQACGRVFPGMLDNGMICAGIRGVSSCPGDSGGPLVLKGPTPAEDVQVGIVSWGPKVCGSLVETRRFFSLSSNQKKITETHG